MTDEPMLPEKLRATAAALDSLGYRNAFRRINKAADRIDALTAELAEAQAEAARFTAENERLRAALKPFADAWKIAVEAMPARTLAHFGAIAKHEVSGAHFQRADAALNGPASMTDMTRAAFASVEEGK